MSQHNTALSRAMIFENVVYMAATGESTTFPRQGMTICAKASASTTAFGCPTLTTLPAGLEFTLDNSNGSGTMTMTPTTGTAIAVTTGKVYACTVAASGALKAVERTAAPT